MADPLIGVALLAVIVAFGALIIGALSAIAVRFTADKQVGSRPATR